MAFKDLFLLCRQSNLVSSDLLLQAKLKVFEAHEIVKFRKSWDGLDYLVIPAANTVLHQFFLENCWQ